MKVVFFGTPEIAATVLEYMLKQEQFIVEACISQPDRPKGRGRKLLPTPVKAVAIRHNIPVLQPNSLKSQEVYHQLEKFNPDVIVVVAFGQIVPERILNLPKYGCINVHASILPQYRGAAPINYAILYGDKISGVTIMQMDVGLDTGDILKIAKVNIEPKDTSEELYAKIAQISGPTLCETLEEIVNGKVKSIPQDDRLASYAPKLTKQLAKINWYNSAVEIERKIRAFQPWPVAFTMLGELVIKLWEVEVTHNVEYSVKQFLAGEIIASNKSGIDVVTSNGVLKILKLQLPGGKVISASSVLNSKKELFDVGRRFEVPEE